MSKVIKADQVALRVESPHGAATASARRQRSAALGREILDAAQIVREAKREAAGIVSKAELQAARLMEEAERRLAQADAVVEEARKAGWEEGVEAGRSEGFKAGREEGIAAAQRLVAEVDRVLAGTIEARQALLNEAEEGVVKLALAVAERLLCQEIADGSAKAAAVLRRLVPSIDGSRSVKVRVAPENIDSLGEDAELFGELLQEGAKLELVADPSLGPLDAVVELEWGIIDARLQSRWRRVIEGLDLAPEKVEGEPL